MSSGYEDPPHSAAERAEARVEARMMAEVRTNLQSQNNRLIDIIEVNHRVIEANTQAIGQLLGVMRQVQETLALLIGQITGLVGQVTAGISQRNDAVPLKIVLILFGLMAIIVLAAIGLDATNLLHFGSAP